MSTQNTVVPPVPNDVDRIAHYGYEPDNVYLKVGDSLEQVLDGLDLEQLASTIRSPAPPHALPLLALFQDIEELSDSQTVQELRTRLDWRYALHLPLHLPPISARALADFRRWQRRSEQGQDTLARLEKCLEDLHIPLRGKAQRSA